MNSRILYITIGVVSLILVSLNVLRITHVPITHDEALTYYMYVSGSYGEIFNNPLPTANNHLLNSVLSKFFINSFDDNLTVIRLPNLVAQLLYLLFSYLLVKKLFKEQIWILAGFLLLQFNPYMFEFWGLCRGYGLAFAFMMASLYFLFRYLSEERFSMLLFSGAATIVAIYANLAILNYAMGFTVVVLLDAIYKDRKQHTIKAVSALVVFAAIAFLLLAESVGVLIERKELYYGGDRGFVTDTIGTLLRETFFLHDNNHIGDYLSVIVAVLDVLMGIYLIRALLRKQKKFYVVFLCWLLLVIPALSTITQHYLLGSKFLIDRTALFFYPLFIIHLLYALYVIRMVKPKLVNAVLWPLLIVMTLNFTMNVNFKTARNWYYDAHVPWLINRMTAQKQTQDRIKMYLDNLFPPSMRYTIERGYADEFYPVEGYGEAAFKRTEYDYYLIRDWELHKVPDIFEIDTVFHNNLFYLYKRKQ